MPKVELYINNQLCDLKGDEEINVDYAIFDISKIDSRGGARSYEFSIPKTNRNKTVLENPEMVNNLSDVPYARNSALVLVDGVDVLIRFCEVSSVKDAYQIRVYGGNSDIFNQIRDLKLTDIDLIEFDHYWNIANTIATRTQTDGYVYPIIDYHEDSPNYAINNDNTAVRVDYILPAIFYNTILNKIFAAIGYAVTNTIEEDTAKLILPYSGAYPRRNLDGRRYEGVFTLNALLIDGVSPGITITSIPPAGDLTPIWYNVLTSTPAQFFTEGTTGIDNKHYFADAFTVTIDFVFLIQNNDFTNTEMLFAYTYTTLNNTNTSDHFLIDTLPGTHVYSHSITISVNPVSAQDNALTYLYFRAYPTKPGVDLTILNGSKIEFRDVVIDNPLTINYSSGVVPHKYNYITLNSILENFTQLQLLKNYMQMFCLMPSVNGPDGTITFVKFDDLLKSLYLAYDWSDKIDWGDDYEFKYTLSEYAQNNYLKYTQDGDELPPNGTNGNIKIYNKNLEFEKDAIELDFAGTNTEKLLLDMDICRIPVYDQGEYTNEKTQRVLNIELQTVSGLGIGYYVDGGTIYFTTDNVPIPYFIKQNQDLSLGFENNLISEYYELLSKILNRVKILTISVRLSAADISQLDFTRPVFIKKFEAYFYISAVKGFSYTESKSTIVELVKLNING